MAVTSTESLKPKTVNGVPVEAEEQPKRQEAPKVAAKSDEVTINLSTTHYNHYSLEEALKLGYTARDLDSKSRVAFGPGEVTVPRDVAADLLRRDREITREQWERINGANRYQGEIAQMG